MHASLAAALAANLFLAAVPLRQGEMVYPPTGDIMSRYALSADTLLPSQTLTIYRTIVNRTNFDIVGLYFSDNLSPRFTVVDQRAVINNREVACGVVGPLRDHEIQGRDTYYWIIDSKGAIPGVGEPVASGDSVRLEVDIKCPDWGRFFLPAHAAVFWAGGYAYFSTSDTMQVVFDVRTDTGERPARAAGPRTRAYPNPFNATVVIEYDGFEASSRTISLAVYDPLGRIVHAQLDAGGQRGEIVWRPEPSLSSGVYLYRLSDGNRSAGGKLLLVR